MPGSCSSSIRSTDRPPAGAGLGAAGSTLTHSRPPATVSEFGEFPRSIVFVTRFVRGSMRETVPERLFATQTAPAPTAMPDGSRPTGISALTERVAGSIRATVPSRLFTTQIAPAPAAIGPGPLPIGIVSVTAPDAIRCTVLSVLSETHRAPAPTASPAGSLPTSTRSTTRRVAVSTRSTAASSVLATHREPPSSAAAGRVASWLPVSVVVWSGTDSATAPRSASKRRARPRWLSAIQAEPPPTASASTPTSA